MNLAKIFVVFILAGITHNLHSSSDDLNVPPPISGREANSSELTPSDVYSRITLIEKEIEIIRQYMGKDNIAEINYPIKDVVPRQVFFQVKTITRGVKELYAEVSDNLSPNVRYAISTDEIVTPSVVWKQANEALKNIYLIKKKMNIYEIVQEVTVTGKKPTDVFRKVINVNRKINNLLLKKISPRDVYQQVSQSINVTVALLSEFNRTSRIIKIPEYQTKKTPKEVFEELLQCYRVIGEISEHLNIKIGRIDYLEFESIKKKPNDVYDLASLILSEVEFIRIQKKNSKYVLRAPMPTYKLPSDVFQRASLLRAQLNLLLKKIKKDK